jgi:pilus assembly protein FimV
MSAPDLVWETETLAAPEEVQAAPAEVEPRADIPEPLEEIGALAEDILEPEASAEAFAPESDMSRFEAGPEAGPEPMEELTAELPRETPIEEAFPEISAQDFDLSVAEMEPEPESVPELDLSGIDLDLETPEFPAMAEASGEIAEAIETSLDFEPASLTAAEAAAPEAVALAPEPAAAVEAEPAEAAMDPELREEVNTKLDLARAYLEMGDREGAREILQEVLNEGDAGQKAEAGKLMAEAG